MDAVHKEIMVKLDAHQERMEAWQEEMKAVWEARTAIDLGANP
jgi:hypothetical protein